MPKSKSKPTARAVSTARLSEHPAMKSPDCMLQCRMGSEEPMRLPDEIVERTGATVLPDTIKITANADGDALLVVGCGLSHITYTITSGVVGATPTYNPTARFTAFTGATSYARLVCVKTVVEYIGAEMASSGYVSTGKRVLISEITGKNISDLHNDSEMQSRVQDGLTVFTGYRQSPRFEDPGPATFMQGTIPQTYFVFSGLPAGAVIKIRILRFAEYQAIQGSIQQGDQKSEPYNPGAMAVASQLGMTVTSMFRNTDASKFMSTLKTAASAAYHLAAPIGSYVAPQARSYLAGLATRAAPLMLGM